MVGERGFESPTPWSRTRFPISSVQFLLRNTKELSQEKQEELQKGSQCGTPLVFLGGNDSYKIDYSTEAPKSRCVTGNINIALNINSLCWSGRRDSNPRPSAPKADALPGCATPRHSGSIVSRIGLGLRAEQGSAPEVSTPGGAVLRAPFDATIDRVYGGYSSAAERLTVAQDVVGSIPTSRPNLPSPQGTP